MKIINAKDTFPIILTQLLANFAVIGKIMTKLTEKIE